MGSETIPENRSTTRKSLALSFYTLLSRILGLVRDHFMAVSFGTGMVASAFSVAYRLPNMFRNLLAEGTLSQSFMPIFSEYESLGKDEVRVMTGVVLSFLFFALSLFVAIFWFFAGSFLPLLVGGSPEYGKLVVDLSLVLFFLIMTASLSSIFMSISNAKHHFFVPSLSPILLNLSYIFVFLVVFPFVEDLETRVFYLAFGIVAGGILQLVLQASYVISLGYGPIFHWNTKHPAIRKIFRLMIPAAIGGSFYQLGLLVDIFLANYIQNNNPGLGAVVSLDYAQRLVQLPTGIIGVALATTILPSLLSSLKEGKRDLISKEISHVLGFAFFLTLPASLGLLFLGHEVLNAIYLGGKWTEDATNTAFLPLLFYGLAIPFFSANKVLISSFYAFKDTKTPLYVQMTSFVLSVVLGFSLIPFFLHGSIALASAISAATTFTILSLSLNKHKARYDIGSFFSRLKHLLLPLLVLSLWLVFAEYLWVHSLKVMLLKFVSLPNANRIFLAIFIPAGILFYLVASLVLDVPELQIVRDKIRSRKKKG